MRDSEYNELSSPLFSESGSKSSSDKRTAAKLIVGISGLVVFGYLMSTINFSSPESRFINLLNSSEANFKGLVDHYQLELVSAPEKVGEIQLDKQTNPELAISKDNSLLTFTTDKGVTEVWDVKTKNRYAVLEDDARATEVIFTPDGKYLICTTFTENVIIWDLASKSIYGKINTKERAQYIYATSDSKSVVVGTYDEVSIWSIEDLKKSHTFDLSGLREVEDVVMTSDSKYIAIAVFDYSYGRIVRVFDMSSKKKITTLHTKIHGKLSISDDGKILAVAKSWGEFSKVWNIETKELIANIKGDRLYLSPNGRFVYISRSGGDLIYDLKDKTTIFETEDYSSRLPTFTKNGKFLVYSEDNIIKILDLEKYEVVANLDYGRYRIMKTLKLSENGEYLLVKVDDQIDFYSLKNLYN
jgi:WD40 repeat protein